MPLLDRVPLPVTSLLSLCAVLAVVSAIEECSSATYLGWYESVCGPEPR